MAISVAELQKALVESKKLSEEDFSKISETANRLNSTVEQILLGKGFFTESELGVVLAKRYGVDFIELGKIEITPDILFSIPKEIASRKKVIVFDKGRGIMKVAIV